MASNDASMALMKGRLLASSFGPPPMCMPDKWTLSSGSAAPLLAGVADPAEAAGAGKAGEAEAGAEAVGGGAELVAGAMTVALTGDACPAEATGKTAPGWRTSGHSEAAWPLAQPVNMGSNAPIKYVVVELMPPT
jgi:hypothetical protein